MEDNKKKEGSSDLGLAHIASEAVKNNTTEKKEQKERINNQSQQEKPKRQNTNNNGNKSNRQPPKNRNKKYTGTNNQNANSNTKKRSANHKPNNVQKNRNNNNRQNIKQNNKITNNNGNDKTKTFTSVQTNQNNNTINKQPLNNINNTIPKKRKFKWASWSLKKKIAVVFGFLFLILCIIAAIGLITGHGLFGRLGGKLNWSESNVSYDDVDLDKEDTINEEEENERIKKELENISSDIITQDGVVNILLIGEDLRPEDDGEAGNTDVMLLISFNHNNKTITMTSFMRDIYSPIYGKNCSNRINAAYKMGSADTLEQTIENDFGIEIDRYVIVNFESFIDIVDTLGGLDIYVTQDEAHGGPGYLIPGSYDYSHGMEDPLDEQNYILGNDDETDYLTIHGEGETVHLNGNQALAYARTRYIGNCDFDRTQRQRDIMKKIVEKTKNSSLSTIYKIAKKVLPKTHTDMEEAEAWGFVSNAISYSNYTVNELRIPVDNSFTDETINGMAVLKVDYQINTYELQTAVYGKSTIPKPQTYQDSFANQQNNNNYNQPYNNYAQ